MIKALYIDVWDTLSEVWECLVALPVIESLLGERTIVTMASRTTVCLSLCQGSSFQEYWIPLRPVFPFPEKPEIRGPILFNFPLRVLILRSRRKLKARMKLFGNVKDHIIFVYDKRILLRVSSYRTKRARNALLEKVYLNFAASRTRTHAARQPDTFLMQIEN